MKDSLPPDSTISHYRILTQIGAGGMGEVYLAEDARLGRKVALKLLPTAFTEDPDRLRRFEQEARAASGLNHPNIITIHDVGEFGSLRFIITEFIEGHTLRKRMTDSQMKLPVVLDIAVQVAGALEAAHAAGIVHRDLKPENIMVRRDGFVKVLDFGLAKLTTSPLTPPGNTETQSGVVLGTLRYMSPEQARGLKVDARTDIFSLGAVLYEMVAGRSPFEGATAGDVIAAILERPPQPIQRYAPETPAELQRIICKTLAKEREERYQTIKDLQIDLRNLIRELEFTAHRSLPQLGPQERATQEATPVAVIPDAAGVRTPSGSIYLAEAVKRHKPVFLAVSLLVTVIAALLYFGVIGGKEPAIESLAVLPFGNSSADPNAEYLSDGITDSLINSLSQVPKLRVMSHNSVFRYKGHDTDAQAAGKQLGVRAVLTGRVVTRGDSISISTELVDTRDNSHVWGEQYNNRLSDLMAVQAEISRDISDKLRLKLRGQDQRQLSKRSTENAQAYDLFLKGRYYMNTMTDEGLNKGLAYFQRAIEADSRYGAAYAGLAECYTQLANLGATFAMPPAEAFPKAKVAAVKALELDDTLAEAHNSLGLIAMSFEWDWNYAEREFKRALALNPNYVNARHWYSHYLICRGRFDESQAESEQALALDPLDVGMNFHLGFHYFSSRRYDEAAAQLRKTLEMDPSSAAAHGILGLVYEQKGLFDEAVAELRKSMELGGADARGNIGHVYAVAGRRGEAQKLLNELQDESRRKSVSPYNIAAIYEGLGQKEQALSWLEKAYEERDSNIISLGFDPEFKGVRSDPRFAELLRRIGL